MSVSSNKKSYSGEEECARLIPDINCLLVTLRNPWPPVQARLEDGNEESGIKKPVFSRHVQPYG